MWTSSFHFLVTRLALPLIQVNAPSTLANSNPPSVLHTEQDSLHTLPHQIHPKAQKLAAPDPCPDSSLPLVHRLISAAEKLQSRFPSSLVPPCLRAKQQPA